jgi:hypothetical protein
MRRASLQRLRRSAVTASISLFCLRCGGSPTSPERHGLPQVTINCAVQATVTQCQAPVGCSLYPCAAGTPKDVTQTATWSVDNTAVARIVGQGLVQSVGAGHTVVRVSASPYGESFLAIGVFDGTAPLPTYEYEGSVFDGGGPPRTPLNGAQVEILTGLPAGRTTISGSLPEVLPGATVVAFPGHYAFFGVPGGTYRLRVSKSGYAAQEIETRQFADVTLLPLITHSTN